MNSFQLPQQKVFDFSFSDNYSFGQFIHGTNSVELGILHHALAQVTASNQFLYLAGESGSGCTHLLKASCQQLNQAGLLTAYLSLAHGIGQIESISASVGRLNLIVLDGLEKICNVYEYERSVFNLFNQIYDQGCSLIVSAHQPPRQLAIGIPDLYTRLASCLLLHIKPLTGDDLIQFVKHLFNLRQIDIEPTIIDYILTRYSRNCDYLRQAVHRIEQESLRLHKPITRLFVRSCLEGVPIKHQEY